MKCSTKERVKKDNQWIEFITSVNNSCKQLYLGYRMICIIE